MKKVRNRVHAYLCLLLSEDLGAERRELNLWEVQEVTFVVDCEDGRVKKRYENKNC